MRGISVRGRRAGNVRGPRDNCGGGISWACSSQKQFCAAKQMFNHGLHGWAQMKNGFIRAHPCNPWLKWSDRIGSASVGEAVADAGLGLEEIRLAGGRLELLAEIGHVDAQVVRVL